MIRRLVFMLPFALLAGCDMVVLSPSGYVAAQQSNMLVNATVLMLLIIIPVMGLTAFFAWRYSAQRKSNYDPDWHHSTSLELVIWAAPLMIIICLGGITWVGTHLLDPFRPLTHIGERRQVPVGVKPVDIEVVALDWKWLFIYPEYGIATVNEAAVPIDRPIHFRLTSESVMNAFYVPALAGMIYAMPGMESQLHAVMNVPGDYEGFSSNYSGAGFSNMRFRFRGMAPSEFSAWINEVRTKPGNLDRPDYLKLAEPSEKVPPQRFGTVDPDLFRRIVNRCVAEGRMCIDEMNAADSRGGSGESGALNTVPVEGRQASAFGQAPFYVSQHRTDSVAVLDPPGADGGTGATHLTGGDANGH